MRKQRIYVTMMLACAIFGVRADEGMWLLQMMEEQYLVEQMKQQGGETDNWMWHSPAPLLLAADSGIDACRGGIAT